MRALVLSVVVAGPLGCFSDPSAATTGSGSSGFVDSTGAALPTTGSTTTLGSTGSSTTTDADSSTSGAADTSGSSSSTGESVEPWAPRRLWLTPLDGGEEGVGDRTDALWIDEDTIWAAGAFARQSAASQISLHTLELSGELIETFVYVDEERLTNARTMTPSQSGMWIGGLIDTEVGGTDRLLLNFSTSAASFTRLDLWPQTPGNDSIQTAQSDGAQLFLGGRVTTQEDDSQRWTARVIGTKLDWTRADGPAGTGPNSIRGSVQMSTDQHVVFVGASADKTQGTIPWAERLNIAGDDQWSANLPGAVWTNASAFAATTNASGDVFVAGAASVQDQGLDAWVMRVGGNSGAVSWTTPLDESGLDDVATSIAATADAIFVCGSVRTDDAGLDAWIAKLDLSGEQLGAVVFDGGLLEDDQILSCVAHESMLVIAGSIHRPDGVDRDGFVAAYPVD